MISVGPGARDGHGNLIPVSVKEGDTVLLPEYGGSQIKLGEKEYVLVLLSLANIIVSRITFLGKVHWSSV